MTDRRPEDDDDGRAAGNRSQTRAVPDAGSFPPRSTFGTADPLRAEQAGATAPPRPATGAKPAGIWGQTIALGAAVPPAQHPHAAPPGPAPGPAEPDAPVVQRAVVVMPAVQAGQQPPRGPARGPGHGAAPPAPQADRGQRQPPARYVGTDSDRPAPDATHAAEPLRVPSQRPAPAPFKSSQRGAPAKGTLLMSGLGADSRPPGTTPVAATPAAARPPAAQTVPLGGDGKLGRATPPAATPAGPGATRQLRPGAGRPRAEAPESEPAEQAPPHGDLSFAATMPSVPPSAIPPQASAPTPPRTPAPARPAQSGRDQIRLQLDDADFVQRAPSSIPGVPRQNPMLIVGGGLVLVLLVVIGWFLMREPAAPPAKVPTAEPSVAPVAPVAPTPSEATAPGAAPTAVGGSAATATPTPAAVQPEPTPSTPKATAVPAVEPSAPKAAARRPSKGGKSKAKPSDDVSEARDALRALEREPILKVKPSREDSDDEPAPLGPADAPTMAPPAPGE